MRKSVEEIKLELIGRIERYFGDRVTEITICELVDVPNHYIYASYSGYMTTIGFNLITIMVYAGSLLIWVMNLERRLKVE